MAKDKKQDANQSTIVSAPQAVDGRTRRARREAKRRARDAEKKATMTPHGTARKILRSKMPWEAINDIRDEDGRSKTTWKHAARKMGKLV